MLTHTRELVTAAATAGHGVGAFNVITLEYVEAVLTGAESVGRPVILQISENAVTFHGGRLAPFAAAATALAATSAVPAALHLDHVTDVTLLHQAPACGFSSVMYDASALEYDDNVAATAAAADFCHRHGLWLEGELGAIGGKDGAHAPGVRTDPAEAARFVAATRLDALAVAVGSSHAMTTRTTTIDHDLVARLRAAVPVPLVLHGGSGVGDRELAAAIAHGLVKINVGTALNVALTRALRGALDAGAGVVDPRRYLAPARDAVARTVAETLLRLDPARLDAAPVPA